MDAINKFKTWNSTYMHALEAVNKNYDLYIQGLKEIFAELKKDKSTKIDLWAIICISRKYKDALHHLLRFTSYEVSSTESKDYPIIIDPNNDNKVVQSLVSYQYDMKHMVAIWLSISSVDFNEVEIEGCRDIISKESLERNGFSTLKDGINATIMFPFWKRFFCGLFKKHYYSYQYMYVKMIGMHDYIEYVPVRVVRCTKCGHVKDMKFGD